MRVISLKGLRAFWAAGHGKAEGPLRRWYRQVEAADWASLDDARRTFPHADAVKVGRETLTVFNIAGNDYRVITRIVYPYRRVYIRAVLTHAEYNKGRWKQET